MELHFFKPEFFSALVILGVILLIHLFNRPKTVVLKFSTLQFFNIDAPKKTKTNKLRKLLLLFTRLLLVTLIVFLFADPYFEKGVANSLLNPNISVYIWLDHSPSMDYYDGHTTIGQKAAELVDSLMERIPVTGKKYVYDYTTADFTDYTSGKINFQSRHGPLKLESVLTNIKRHISFSPHSVIFLISDYQSATADELDSVMSLVAIKNNTIFMDMTPESPWNFSIQKAEFTGGAAIEVEVTASGRALLSGKIGVSSKNVHSVPVSVSVEKDSTAKVILPFRDQAKGIYTVQLYEDDPLQFDNTQSVSTDIMDDGAVAIIGNVNDNFVIAKAFEALKGEYWGTLFLRDCSTISDEEIDQASIFVINNSGAPCPVIEKIISSPGIVNKSIFYCMGIDSTIFAPNDLTILKNTIPSLNNVQIKHVESFVYPMFPDTNSSLWYGFKGKVEKMVRIKSYNQTIPGFPLCYLSDGGVLFSTLIDKKGIQWIFSSTPLGQNSSNNFWQSGIYVPLLDRLGRFARSRATMGTSIIAGYTVRNPIFNSRKSGLMYDPEGKLYTVANKPHIVFNRPGIYNVFDNDRTLQHISVIADTRESRMKYHTPAIGDIMDNQAVYRPDDVLQFLDRKGSDVSYFAFWLILALLVLMEIVLREKKVPVLK